MRIVTAILLLLAGGGLIAYSYIGAIFTFAEEVEQTARSGNESSAIGMIFDLIAGGQVPQDMGIFSAGLLVMVLAVFVLLGLIGKKRNREDYE